MPLHVDSHYLFCVALSDGNLNEHTTFADILGPLRNEVEGEINGKVIFLLCNQANVPPQAIRPRYMITEDGQELRWSQSSLNHEQMTEINYRLYWYIGARFEGHSSEYAEAGLREFQWRKVTPTSTERELVLFAYPDLPESWLHTTTNSCGLLSYQVIDNGLLWDYFPVAYKDLVAMEIISNSPGHDVRWWFNPTRHDAQEYDAALRPQFEAAEAEAQGILEAKGIQGMGTCHAYWDELERILSEKYSIKWRSPSLLNPDTMYD